MTEPFIPDEVQAFLLQSIDSIAQLEALLLLHDNPTCTWTAEALAKRLYIPTQETAVILQRLTADGFLTLRRNSPEQYQYHPQSSEHAAKVDQVASLYTKYLIPITRIIHAKPRSRVQEFADAFKLHKGE
jgi:hypothetical protein